MPGRIPFVILLTALALFQTANRLFAAEPADDFFEKSVRPLLVDRCLKCHNAQKQSGGLRLDSGANLLKGGESGAVVVSGKPEGSLLIEAVRREGLEMPPDEKLSAEEVRVLEEWVKLGAPWPKSEVLKPAESADRAKTHWAFQAVTKPEVPQVDDPRAETPIDAFVLGKLKSQGLDFSPKADRRTLIRRLSFSLTGLPPSPEEVDAFVNDSDPRAYERLVDRLLESPHYGEHWARFWLDLSRYSDTKGYVYAREERFWVHAWAYRDWVVNSLNDDLPYDRFLLLQLAGDQVDDRKPGDLAAMGFLTLGRRFLGVTHEIIDDRIDVVCRSTMALTVACARCHDHKYDPIPTAEYYSLYGVFDSSAEKIVPLSMEPLGDKKFRAELAARQKKLADTLAASRKESADLVRQRIEDYLRAQTELEKYPPQGFDQIFEKSDILPEFVRRWETYLQEAKRRDDPVFRHWHAYLEIPIEEFSKGAVEVTRRLSGEEADAIPSLVKVAFTEPPASFDEVIERYAKIFQQVDDTGKARSETAIAGKPYARAQRLDSELEKLRRVLYGASAPCEVPDEPIVHSENYFDSATCTAIWKLQGEVDRFLIRSKVEAPYALALVDRDTPTEPRIFRRGDPTKMGEAVPRRFLSLLSGENPKPFQKGSGRLELARAIIDPANPLTARVIVNRVWARHFGQGLVTTTSDFGLRADPPSHPELLDWLTLEFVEDGWSLKKLHRRILLSETYRQSSAGPADPARKARAVQRDPGNRLLWRMNSHRLSFEEFRDSLLKVTGKLDRRIGGKPVELLKPPFPDRRSLYGLVDRQYFPSAFRVFDVANPDLHIAERSETTVPQQSLFFLNHPLVLDRAADLAGDKAEIRGLFRTVFQREPTVREIREAAAFLKEVEPEPTPPPRVTAKDWQYGYGFYDEAKRQVTGFEKLPHFTGSAWQGGPAWPDAKLGWVQLTAEGGHPGNDLKHAAVRRWTAPRDVTIQVESRVIHEPAAGDGIRAFISCPSSNLELSARVHQKSVKLGVDSLSLQAGQTLDFVVDIGKVLNSDNFHWTVSLKEITTAGEPLVWDSQSDFTSAEAKRLTPWEQLAQVLLCSNEFLFVD